MSSENQPSTKKSTKTKKIDSRIRTLIENAVKQNQRSFFIITGSNAKQQILPLHYMLSKARDSQKPSILWCYNKELGFQGDNQARLKQFKVMAKKRQEHVVKSKEIRKKKARLDVLHKEMENLLSDPFHLFLSCTDVKYSYYRDTHKVLGNTYGMLVLQDFEGITPNILARTIETVEGTGMIVLLLPDLESLSQLYTMAMDVHSKFVSSGFDEADESKERPKGRFNERFLLSLATCQNAIVMDDELNVLPLSSHITSIVPVERDEDDKVGEKGAFVSERQKDLNKLVQQLQDTPPLGPIASLSRTMDQCEALVQFVEAISEKTLQTTVALTAARGRGKSATLGLSMAAAVAYGYSNIFVTAPSPENLHTLFDFVCRGFNALGMKDTVDYELVKSTHSDTKGAVIRINIFREHRQTIQYIHPEDAAKLGQAELVVIDEAAAIPLPIVRKLFGPYLVFISSTVNGYEGTGRSLSLKLIEELKNQYASGSGGVSSKFSLGRKFHELTLDEPIRYARNDPVESWLYKLLCLDATSPPTVARAPHPDDCKLYYVNRDTLFSFHAASEKFLHNMMSLFVSSHYKNSPNDLQLLSDAPDQHIFVLLGPIDENSTSLPDIFCVVQMGFEGKIRKDIVQQYFQHGKAPSGDLIPYVVSRQFQEVEFSSLSGARIVRVATHPQWQKMGYGSKALSELEKYFKKELISISEESEEEEDDDMEDDVDDAEESAANGHDAPSLRTEIIKPKDRTQLPPLLQELTERAPEDLDYLGVSFGLTDPLYRFWMRAHFEPVYIRLSKNALTGEHSTIMLRGLKNNSSSWLNQFTSDFRRRFISLLSFDFKAFPLGLVLSILQFDSKHASTDKPLTVQEFDAIFSAFDFKRLVAYSKDMVDYHVIIDLIPQLCKWFFEKRTDFTLNLQQASILVGLGLQHRSISEICEELNKPSNQLLALFNKSIRKFVRFLSELSKNRYVEEKQLSDESVAAPAKKSAPIDEVENDDSDASSADEKQAKFDAIFGASSTGNKKSQKRKREAEESSGNKKPKVVVTPDASVVESILRQDEFKVSHVDVDAMTKDSDSKKPRKIHKHMMKSKSELNRMKKAEKNKIYKKDGKKKRKIYS